MMNADDLKNHFEELKTKSMQKDARIYGRNNLWESWHDLADSRDEQAKKFFIERLQDNRSTWRELCISLLGFHYKLENELLEKIRDLLIADPDSGVRISAAGVLGSQGRYPEKALLHALNTDPNDIVRECAFDALLSLAGVPSRTIRKEVVRIKSKEITASLVEVKRVLREQNMLTNISLLEEMMD